VCLYVGSYCAYRIHSADQVVSNQFYEYHVMHNLSCLKLPHLTRLTRHSCTFLVIVFTELILPSFLPLHLSPRVPVLVLAPYVQSMYRAERNNHGSLWLGCSSVRTAVYLPPKSTLLLQQRTSIAATLSRARRSLIAKQSSDR
jgi:hypothetical protein